MTYLSLKYIRILFLFLCSLAGCSAMFAQELNCSVTINTEQVSGSKNVFNALEESIREYLNTNVFTNAQFSANEKIECRFYLTVKEYLDGKLTGDIQVQSLRPVYNSSYTTTLLNFKDTKVDFDYQENQPLVFSINNMESQLTAILNFYAYLIIAMDFDSFSLHGGDQYFERLKQIVQMAQSSGESGWKAFEDTKNRSAVLSVFTEPATSGIRDMIYNYHRLGLDMMATSVDKGRAVVTESLGVISNIASTNPMSVGLSMFKDAKMDELVNIYSKAPSDERTKVYNLLQPIYPTEESRLEQIKKGAQEQP